MNYLAEIKAFYDLVQVKQLSTGQIALWHALMAINNKCAWIEWFTVPNIMLELNTGMSRSGVLKARNSLKQYGLIDFKANGTKATNYKMVTIAKSKQESNQESTQESEQASKQDSTQVSKQDSNTLNKLNETKQKRKNIKKEFTPPTLEEIEKYILEKKLQVDSKKFYNYFTEGKWVDSNGNKVKNWKQKLITWSSYSKDTKQVENKKTNFEQRTYTENDFSKLYANLGGMENDNS